jgi:hypothetical protein
MKRSAFFATAILAWQLGACPSVLEGLAGESNALSPLRRGGTGVAVLDTRAAFPEPAMRALLSRLPKFATIYLVKYGERSEGEVCCEGPQRRLPQEDIAFFQSYLEKVIESINRTLAPNENVELESAEIRITHPESKDIPFLNWHLDAFYMAFTVSLIGPGTDYIANSPKFSADAVEALDSKGSFSDRQDVLHTLRGETLIFSAIDRAARYHDVAATIHRTPEPLPEARMLLIARLRSGRARR